MLQLSGTELHEDGVKYGSAALNSMYIIYRTLSSLSDGHSSIATFFEIHYVEYFIA